MFCWNKRKERERKRGFPFSNIHVNPTPVAHVIHICAVKHNTRATCRQVNVRVTTVRQWSSENQFWDVCIEYMQILRAVAAHVGLLAD